MVVRGTTVRRLTLGCLALLAAVACSSPAPSATEGIKPGTDPSGTDTAVDEAGQWEVRGVFVRPSFAGRAMLVDHEEIPGVMGAMAMDIRVDDPALLDGLAPGDKIRFTLHEDGAQLRASAIEKLPADTPLTLAGDDAHGDDSLGDDAHGDDAHGDDGL